MNRPSYSICGAPDAEADGAAAETLNLTAAVSWLFFVLVTGTEQIVAEIKDLRAHLVDYGAEQHSAGVVNGIEHAASLNPASPLKLHGLR